jgi:PST family polysaccharide transporter
VNRLAIVRALGWSALERGGASVIFLVSGLIIARLIGPQAFGLGSLALSVVFTFQIATERLFHDVIVRRPEALTGPERNTAFTAAIIAAGVLSLILLVAADPMASLFHQPALSPLIQLATVPVLASGPGGVLIALIHRDMGFHKLAIRTLVGALTGAVAGLICAAAGLGALSLVVQNVAQILGATVAAFIAVGHVPRLAIERKSLKELGAYSLTVLAELTVYTGALRVFIALVGLIAGIGYVGFIELALRLTGTLANLWSSAINPIVLLMFANLKQQREAVAAAYLRASQLNAAVVIPVFCGIAFIAGDLIFLIAGPDWMPAAVALQVLSFEAAIRLSRQFSSQVFHAFGRPTFALYGAMIGFAAANGMLLLFRPHDLFFITLIWTARYLFTAPIGGWFIRRLTGLSALAQALPLAAPAAAAGAMLLGLYALHVFVFANLAPLWRMPMEIAIGAAIYGVVILRLSPWLWPLLADAATHLKGMVAFSPEAPKAADDKAP